MPTTRSIRIRFRTFKEALAVYRWANREQDTLRASLPYLGSDLKQLVLARISMEAWHSMAHHAA